MTNFSVCKKFGWDGEVTDNVRTLCRMFGLTIDRLTEQAKTYSCRLDVRDGDIVYFTGPSGSGKTVLLRELQKLLAPEQKVNLNEMNLPSDKALIDCIDSDFYTSLKTLSIAGLNDVFCILNKPVNLSEGQQYRFRLAKAISSGRKFIFADEFCTSLDGITASVVSFEVRKFAKRENVTFLLAGCRRDLLADLQPDIIVERDLSGNTNVVYKDRSRQECKAVR